MTRWRTITGPMAFCLHCPMSDASVYHGDQDRDVRRTLRLAREHANATGHEVIVERGQTLAVRPRQDPQPTQEHRMKPTKQDFDRYVDEVIEIVNGPVAISVEQAAKRVALGAGLDSAKEIREAAAARFEGQQSAGEYDL